MLPARSPCIEATTMMLSHRRRAIGIVLITGVVAFVLWWSQLPKLWRKDLEVYENVMRLRIPSSAIVLDYEADTGWTAPAYYLKISIPRDELSAFLQNSPFRQVQLGKDNRLGLFSCLWKSPGIATAHVALDEYYTLQIGVRDESSERVVV